MFAISSLDDHALLARLPGLRAVEREATAELIAHLGELDRRRLYAEAACSSLTSYCTERLGYSENEAQVRVAVARLCQRLPQVLDELRSGQIHLTGLFLLSGRLTAENCDTLLAEARGKSRREIEAVLARWFPRADVLPSVTPLTGCPATMLEHGGPAAPTMPGPDGSGAIPAAKPRVQPLSAASYRVEFTASAQLHEKLVKAQNLLGHAVPSGDLAALFERALDQLIAAETKRRSGSTKPRKRRPANPRSRHVPVDVQRAVRERDGEQCTFTDAEGRRCSEQRYLTIEHIVPFARGGPTTVENCCLLCKAHNSHRARQVFGHAHIREKIAQARARRKANKPPSVAPTLPVSSPTVPDAPPDPPEPDVFEKVAAGLVKLGFSRPAARRAVEQVRTLGVERRPEPVLRAALALLTP